MPRARLRGPALSCLLTLGLGLFASSPSALSARAQAPSTSPIPAHTSVGSPQEGRIEGGGVELPPRGPGYHWVTNRRNEGARFGVPRLVRALTRAAAQVAERHPGSDIAIHDLSFERGGRIRGHGSHTSGRDADVAYYALTPSGAPMNPTRSIWFTAGGLERGATTAAAARIDPERNWLLVSSLLEDRSIEVQYIFMARPLSRLLLRHARGNAASGLIQRATAVLRVPRGRGVDPHLDHLHLRIRCPAADRAHGCTDARRRRR